ncbi:MAG TPA: adenylyltransferase/cytidyltransferase family protein, partial [Armatimonadota bacterium]|nr:adenylyltransferase/cytidyltransferase family protein [Armatimonadota bacterium]
MNVIMGLENVPDGLVKSAVSIGIFDGVHLGHQTLLSVLRSEAERLSGPAVVLTFDRHPSELLSQGNAPLYITPLDRRLELIQQTGVDLVVVAQFDEKLAALTPEEFTDQVLIDRLKAASVV